MPSWTNTLQDLVENYDIIGLKASFEDEGAPLDDVNEIVQIANLKGLKTTIKIGGCEAKTDLFTCRRLNIDNIVAPMIESEFAVTKFAEALNETHACPTTENRFYVNIESIAAVKNAKEIIAAGKSFLDGVVVGRSDLCKSLGLTKADTNSDVILNHTIRVLRVAKKAGLETTVGGNINSSGLNFIKRLNSLKLIDRIETRSVVCRVDNRLLKNYQRFIDLAIEFEKSVLEDRLKEVSIRQNKLMKRINAISSRKSFLNHVNQSEKSVLVVDFDNVIHNMTDGYGDGTIYGDVVEGTALALEKLSQKYKIIVYTCKANPFRPLVNGMTGTELILEWLIKNDLKRFIDSVTFTKPNAVAYVDDKAIEFSSWDTCLERMKDKELL